jgi:ABC-type polysaccharide/polyol phosphate export permease
MGAYLAAVWRCRYFWMSLVKMDLRTRYRGSMLGMGWSLLHPIAMTCILCIVFATLLGIEVVTYAPFLLAGLACWNYIVSVTLQGCQSFFQGESYIRQYPAPLAIYPLRTALGGTIHFLLALLVAVGLSWYCVGASSVVGYLSLIPSVALLFVFVWSLALLGAFANVYFQDTQHIAEIGFQLLYYLTPIMYDRQMLEDHHLGWLMKINPFVPMLQLIRDPLLHGYRASLTTFAEAGIIVLVTSTAAGLVLATLQKRLIFQL